MRMLLLILTLQIYSGISFAQTAETEIPGFSEVSDGIYRGGRPSAEALPTLQNKNIKTVIDLQGGDADLPAFGWLMSDFEPGERPALIASEKAQSLQLGFQFINYPLSSVKDVNTKEANWINEILGMMADPINRPVFVHCEHGVDRTGLVVALYRVFYEGWSPKDAHDEMMKMGHGAFGNQVLTGAMDRYFRKATKSSRAPASN